MPVPIASGLLRVEIRPGFMLAAAQDDSMGFRSWLSGLIESESSGTDETRGDGQLELEVDVERRAGAVMEHYGLSGEDARQVAEILAAELTRKEGYAKPMIVDRLTRELDVDEELARTVVETEVASVRNQARVRRYAEQVDGKPRFRWVDSVGRDTSEVCADVRAAIDERGPVTHSELQDVIREAASDNEEGTPDRADDLVPHERCRHTVVRHMDQ